MTNFSIFNLPECPLEGLISPLFEWRLDILLVFELGVVDMLEWGDPGLTLSLLLLIEFFVELLFSALIFVVGFGLSELMLEDFCCARRSCFLNFALLFWNQTWKKQNYVDNNKL